MAKRHRGPAGPIHEVDEVETKGGRLDPTYLVGEEEENPEKDVGQIPVDSAKDPFAGAELDLIGPDDGNPKDDGGADFGVDLGAFTERARQGFDVTTPMDEADPGDGGSPGAKFGQDFISAGKGKEPEVVSSELREMTDADGKKWSAVVTIFSDGSYEVDFGKGDVAKGEPGSMTPEQVEEARREQEEAEKNPGSDGGSDPPPDSDGAPETGDVYEAGVIDLSGIGEAVNNWWNSTFRNEKSAGTPAEDYISPEERERIREQIGSASPGVDIDQARKGGAKDGGDIDDPPEGNVPMGVGGDAPDVKGRYLGGDNLEPELGGGRPVGDPPSGGNIDGNTTPPWDAPADPSGSGPFERNKSGGRVQQTPDQEAPPEESVLDRLAGVRDHAPELDPVLSASRRDQGPDFELKESPKAAVIATGPAPKPVQPAVVSAPQPFEPIGIDPSTGSIESPTELVSSLAPTADTADDPTGVQTMGDSRPPVEDQNGDGVISTTDLPAGSTVGNWRDPETRLDLGDPGAAHRAVHPDLPDTVTPLPPMPPKEPEEGTLEDSDDGSADSGDATAGSGDGSVSSGDATAGSDDDATLGDGDSSADPAYAIPVDSTGGSTITDSADPPHAYATDVVFEDRRPELERVDLGGSDEPEPELHTDDDGLEELGG